MTALALLLCLPLPAPGPRPCDLPDVDASDVHRFPPRPVLRARVRFAEGHLEWLDARAKALGPSWRDAEYGYREELKRRLDVWREALCANARAAGAPDEDRSLCEEHLRALRHKLGVRDYNAGRLPELPPWRGRFSRAD
jgi:hypothetical protein